LLAGMKKEKESRVHRLRALEPLLTGGDPNHGREVLFSRRTGCCSRHTIMADDGDVGPEPTGIGAIRSGRDLLEAVVYPNASVRKLSRCGHRPYR